MAIASLNKRDIFIAGGGIIGLSLAIAIKQAVPFLNITIVEAGPACRKDPRATALTAAAVRLFKQLQCWEATAPHAQAIHKMIITDSRLADPVRPTFLTFSKDVAPNEPFAHMVENKYLNTALYERAKALNICMLFEQKVVSFALQAGHIDIHPDGHPPCQAKLLIAADGARSTVRKQAGISCLEWSYPQKGIVATIHHERPHQGCAIEHFLPAGPFAILPLINQRSTLVWNEPPEEAEKLMHADPLLFEVALEQRFGHHLGTFKVDDNRQTFPLGLLLARHFVKPRLALIGDAAHAIHPIAGQGLNLGLSDVAALAEIIVNATRLGLDIGAMNILEDYQCWRRFETTQMGITTDLLNRLFSNDHSALRLLRDIGLGFVERQTWLKDALIKRAAGLNKGAPRLLKGQPL